jgi:hypothetical protein
VQEQRVGTKELTIAQAENGPGSISQNYEFLGSLSKEWTSICIIIILIFILCRIEHLSAFKAVKNELCKNHTVKTIENIFQGSSWAIKSKN